VSLTSSLSVFVCMCWGRGGEGGDVCGRQCPIHGNVPYMILLWLCACLGKGGGGTCVRVGLRIKVLGFEGNVPYIILLGRYACVCGRGG
jgi:hypothetical protein